ncbi:MAG: T9SS type A sorting domain-containing protein [candidate division Zixibacteria bacterium]|nr:T9SS type A sorting domain-containing protein [candidate division Zixibacteria bacterium]
MNVTSNNTARRFLHLLLVHASHSSLRGNVASPRRRTLRTVGRFVALLCGIIMSLAARGVEAAAIATAQSGDWSLGTTWVGGTVPGTDDDVTVASDHVVIVSTDVAAATVTIASNSGVTNGITINPGARLSVSGAVTMTVPTSGTSTISVGAGTLQAGSITIPGSATAGRTCAVTIGSGTIDVTGSVTFTGTAAQAQFTSTGAGMVNIGGNFENGGTLATGGTGTINFNGGAAQTMGAYTTYNNIMISNASGGVTLTGTTTIGGSLTIASGTFSIGPYTTTVSGSTLVSGRLAVTSTTGTKIFTGDVTIGAGGVWDNTSGNEAIEIGGSLLNDGVFDAGAGTYTFSGAAKTISGGNPVSIPRLTVNGTVTNAGVLNVGTTLAGSGTLTNGVSATLEIGGTVSITTLTAGASPNTVVYTGAAQTVRAITYHHLSLSGSGAKTLTSVGTITGNLALSGTCTAATAVATTIGGNLMVGAGTTFTAAGYNLTVTGTTSVSGTLAHSSATGTKTYNGPVTIEPGGSWTNTGNSAITFRGGLVFNGATFSSGTGVYTFSTNPQTIEGAGALTIANVTVTGVTLTNNAPNFTIATALAGTGDLVQGVGATLFLGGASTITTLDATADLNTVNYSGAAQTVKPTTYYHLVLGGSGIKTLTNVGTISGDLTLTGTCSATTAITTTIGGSLFVGAGTTLTVGGYGFTVTGPTSVSGTLAHASSAGAKTHIGSVIIEPGGVWTNAGNSAFTLRGGLRHNGTTFTSGTGVYTFALNPQTVEGASPLTINNLAVDGIPLTNNSSNLTVSAALSGTGQLVQEIGATLFIGGTSTIAGLDATANPNTVVYGGADQAIKAVGYYHLTLSGSGTKTLPGESLTVSGDFTILGTAAAVAGAAIHTVGDFTIGPTASFDAGAFIHDLQGSFSNNHTFTASTSGMVFTGSGVQTIGGTAGTTFNDLTVNKTGGIIGLAATVTIDGTLTLAGGNISTGGNAVVIAETGNVSRTSGHVVGHLRKSISTLSPSQIFEIGDAGSYCPVTVVFSGVTADGALTALVTDGDHPEIAGSTLDPLQSVNKYWTLTNDGIVFADYTADFGFAADDIDAGAKTDSLLVGRSAAGVWTCPTIGTRTSVSTEATGLTGFGDFVVGEDLPEPPVLAVIGPQTVAEGDTLLLDITATDPDGGNPILSAENLPTNAVFDDHGDGTGDLTFTPGYTQAGAYDVTIFVSDGSMIDSEIVAIIVTAANGAPILTAADSLVVAEGDTLTVNIGAIDPDGDPITLTAENLPSNAALVDHGDGTGSFTFYPDFTQAGEYAVTFMASDGLLADSEDVVLTVTAANQLPVLAAIGPQTVAEGDTLNIVVTANDPDGTIPMLTASTLPSHAAFLDNGDGTGTFVFTPDFDQAGVVYITFYASDGWAIDSEQVMITITGVNRPPVLAAVGPQSVVEGDTLIIDIAATDPDADSLALSAENLPANAAFTAHGDGTGRLMFTPAIAQIGVFTVSFMASDDILADSEAVDITVAVHAPVIITGNVLLPGTVVSYVIDSIETVIADWSGIYTISVPYGWSGAVTPTMTGYTFTPADRNYTAVLSDQINQDFMPSIATDVDDETGDPLPDRFAVAQNHPNPFNPSTVIEYAVPKQARVTIAVFDVLGRWVRTLVDDVQPAGWHQVVWDGADQAGSGISTGIYFYRLQADGYTQTRKMVLMK